ncbi:MAG: SusC/RagA family TonB-linked outer membrane protein [Gemmatimonadetes bacterium]|nr:SusC/RagA family TonB-linked outer membrane protein [Gemmatimonadota bacterium]
MNKRTWIAALACAVAAWAVPLAGQQRTISGTVVGENNAPVPSARVAVSGTPRGVETGTDGRFTLPVPAGAVRLTVSRVGYTTRELTVPAGESTVTVTLSPSVLSLDALVVTGQATTVARRNLANAVASVSGEDVMRAPAQTVDKALAAKVPGAIVSTNSGAPGGGVQVDLRGVSSINASADPLWVIDGVVVSNASIPSGQNAITQARPGDDATVQDNPTNRIGDLNPADIESIEVLKGASAAAIYGSKASNGVIIVTTKRGRQGAPRVSASQRLGYYELSNTLGTRRFTREEAIATFGAAAGEMYGDGTHYDHQRQLAGRRDLGRETQLSVSGGSGTTRYFVSGLVMDEPGIIQNTGFERQSLRVNLDQTVGRGIELSVNTNLLHTVAARGLTNNDNRSVSYYMVLSGTPGFVDLRARNGLFPNNPFGASNPLQTSALLTNTEDVWRFIGSGSARVPLMSGEEQNLKLVANGGADFFQQRNRLLSPVELQFESTSPEPGTSILANSDNLNLNGNANLVHTWAPSRFTATTSVGVQYEDRDLNLARIIAHKLAAGQGNVDAGPAPRVFQTRTRVRDVGIFAQEELLMLDSRLLLTAGVRADRSSNNGDTDQYFLYPKAAASYRLPGLLPRVDELKLRAAYGETGNQPLYGDKFTVLDASFSIGGTSGIVVGGVTGAPDIRPERMREVEGGMDLSLLDGRAEFEATAYFQRITDLLLRRTLPASSGFTQEIFNGGELRTRGLELGLRAVPIRRENFAWNSRTTFYTTASRIENLPVPTFRTGAFGSTSLGVFQIEEGKSATQIVGRDGRDPNGRIIERQLGDATPEWKMGFGNELTLGAFSMYGLVDWQHGGDVINLTRLLYDAGEVTDDWVPRDGKVDPVSQCHPNCSGQERISGFGTFTKQYLEDASYVKLREVSLTWRIPAALLSRAPGRVQDASIQFSGRNLVTWTDYTGLDPEVSNFGSQQIARGVDVAPFPPSRSFWVTFNFGF